LPKVLTYERGVRPVVAPAVRAQGGFHLDRSWPSAAIAEIQPVAKQSSESIAWTPMTWQQHSREQLYYGSDRIADTA
jgi:hypothetical protein